MRSAIHAAPTVTAGSLRVSKRSCLRERQNLGCHDAVDYRRAAKPHHDGIERAEGVVDPAEGGRPPLWRRIVQQLGVPDESVGTLADQKSAFVPCRDTDRMHTQHHSLDCRLGVLLDQFLGHGSFA